MKICSFQKCIIIINKPNMVRCNVKGCHRRPEKDKDHSFFLWPKNELIRQQWKDFAQYDGPSSSLRICSDHFDKCNIKKNTPPKRLLVPNAVPTLLSPGKIQEMLGNKGSQQYPINKTMEIPKVAPVTSLRSSSIEIALKNINEVILQHPILKDERVHNGEGIISEVLEARDNEPAEINNIEPNNSVKISIRDIEEKICRTCLNISKSYSSITVRDDGNLIKMVKRCLPQLNLNLVKEPIICQNCISKLEEFHKFLIVCLDIEDRLLKYCNSSNTNFPVDMENILNVKETNVICVKSEGEQIEDIEIKIESDSPNLNTEKHLQNTNFEDEHENKSLDCNKIYSEDLQTKPFQCHICNALFPTKSKLDKHNLSHKVTCIFICNTCKAEFKYKHSFEKHLQTHVNDRALTKLFGCDICGKLFDRKAKMKKHKEIHIVKEKPFVCNTCGKRFIDEELLNGHIYRVHDSEKAFSCELCGNKYSCKSGLDFHMKTHNSIKKSKPEKDIMCDFCGKLFYRNYSLEKHLMSHSGEKPFECEQCNMKFKERYHLTVHMRRHTGEKPFDCKICGFKFASRGRLNIHLKIHSGIKPFLCQICKMAFNRKDHLIKHVRAIHTGERPFACNYCDKLFGRRDHLLKHKKVHINKL